MVLLTKDGTWMNPGGMAQEGKGPKGTAVAEVLEETGVRISREQLQNIGISRGKSGKPAYFYAAKMYGVAAQPAGKRITRIVRRAKDFVDNGGQNEVYGWGWAYKVGSKYTSLITRADF